MNNIISDLYQILESRKQEDSKSSYTAQLYASGLPAISRKVMEEAYEVVEAAYLRKDKSSSASSAELIHEIADLWYHTLVLACQQGVRLEDILQELKNRKEKKSSEHSK